jgi:hypothetical protein
MPKVPLLARVMIDGTWQGNLGFARSLLTDVCRTWPPSLRVLCLATCGAFLRFPWPADIAKQLDNFNPSRDAMRTLESSGRIMCAALLSDGLREKLSERADYLTVGIDSHKPLISTTHNKITEAHAELVFVVDLRSGDTHFTGKSYPTVGQEEGLLRVVDLESHFVRMNGQSTLVLGCHDLTVFNPRSDATVKQPRRMMVKEQLKELCHERKPTIVLHHPHTSTKVGTWRAGWNGLRSKESPVRSYLGTGCYAPAYSPILGWEKTNPLSAVLKCTRSRDVLDIVVRMAGLPN